MKHILVINHSSPFLHQNGREALDTALIFAAIDQHVSVLFQGDAVLCLKPDQQPQAAQLKDYFKTLKTLDLYDVEHLYVCQQSLNDYQLNAESLSLAVTPLNASEIKTLIEQQEHIVTL